MIKLSLDALRLIAQIRNIRDYENKSKEDLIKARTKTRNKTRNKTKTNTKTKTKTKNNN